MNNQTVKTQLRRQVRQRLTDEVMALLKLKPEEGAQWKGTMTDLMEAVHIVYLTGNICHPDGRPYQLDELARRTCRSLNVRPPRSPRRTAYKARQRKGVRCTPLLERCCQRLQQEDNQQQLLTDIG